MHRQFVFLPLILSDRSSLDPANVDVIFPPVCFWFCPVSESLISNVLIFEVGSICTARYAFYIISLITTVPSSITQRGVLHTSLWYSDGYLERRWQVKPIPPLDRSLIYDILSNVKTYITRNDPFLLVKFVFFFCSSLSFLGEIFRFQSYRNHIVS